MVSLNNIDSLTDFLRHHKVHIRRLKRSGKPTVLTVNGKARLVIQDAQSYQELLDAVDRAEAIDGIKRGLTSMRRRKGKPATKVLGRLRQKLKISAR